MHEKPGKQGLMIIHAIASAGIIFLAGGFVAGIDYRGEWRFDDLLDEQFYAPYRFTMVAAWAAYMGFTFWRLYGKYKP